jgi:hypothetical protein
MNSVTRQPSLCVIAQAACAVLLGLATATGAQHLLDAGGGSLNRGAAGQGLPEGREHGRLWNSRW